MTASGMTPLNIYLLLSKLVGIFIASIVWNDWAIMLIHVFALAAMVFGLGVWNGWRCIDNQQTEPQFRSLLWSQARKPRRKGCSLETEVYIWLQGCC